jgi:hypothetical protein
LDNDVMLTALPYSSMSIFRSAMEVPETSDYLIRKLGAGVLANLPREDSSCEPAVYSADDLVSTWC